MTVPTVCPTSIAEKLDRAHYLAALLREVAGLLHQGLGERPVEDALAMVRRDLGELADLLGAVRQERGA